FFFIYFGDLRDLHSFPTRRSSDLVDRHAESRRMKTTVNALDVLAILNRRHDGRVGRGPTDALLFESLHKSRLRVSRRRLREVLFGRDGVELQILSALDYGQTARSLFALVLGLLVAPLLVNFQEAVELQDRAGGAEQ